MFILVTVISLVMIAQTIAIMAGLQYTNNKLDEVGQQIQNLDLSVPAEDADVLLLNAAHDELGPDDSRLEYYQLIHQVRKRNPAAAARHAELRPLP